MESKYLERFKKLPAGTLPLRGDRILIELLPKEEIKSAGGLIIASSLSDHKSLTEMHRGELAIVLATGSGYFDEDGNDVEIDVKPGAVIMVARTSLDFYSKFPGLADFSSQVIAMTREGSIIAAWNNIEDYLNYQRTLNS
jgi:co-chaperonin GroES (HSP10)